MVTWTFAPTGKGTMVSTKQPPGPRSVVRVENLAPEPSSTTSAEAVITCRSLLRRSASPVPTDFPPDGFFCPWSYMIVGSCLPVFTSFSGHRHERAYRAVTGHCLRGGRGVTSPIARDIAQKPIIRGCPEGGQILGSAHNRKRTAMPRL